MKSFLASIMLMILLVSNGMLSAVIDVCCWNDHVTNPISIDCCVQNESTQLTSCCGESEENPVDLDSHKSCEFNSWYYFTPKFIENESQSKKGLFETTLKYISIKSYENLDLGILPHYFKQDADSPPNSFANRPLLEKNCTWII